jgi:hypothetical protein
MQYGTPTFVYFIQEGDEGPIKIGFSRNVQERIKALQTGHAQPLRLLHAMRGTLDDEQRLHRRFARLRIQNEWFAPAPELLDWLAQAAGVPRSEPPTAVDPRPALQLHWAVIAVFVVAAAVLVIGLSFILAPFAAEHWPLTILAWAYAPMVRSMFRYQGYHSRAMLLFGVLGTFAFAAGEVVRIHTVLLPYYELIIGCGAGAIGAFSWWHLERE